MSNRFSSFFNYSRKERIGITALLMLIVLLLSASALIRYCVPTETRLAEQQLQLRWEQAQAAANPQPVADASVATLFYFDPNTVDSQSLLSLGLKAQTAHYLINWRNKGKRFNTAEELQSLYSLSDKDYRRLAPYIRIQQKENEFTKESYSYPKLTALPEQINLNTIDSATLVRIKGIGPILAHKIVAYRNQLGGYMQIQQLLEVFRFADSNMLAYTKQLFIIPNEVRKIKLNTASETELAQHPYIGITMAKNIVLLRRGLNKYENISQLRQVPLMNEEKYRKIAPYCTID